MTQLADINLTDDVPEIDADWTDYALTSTIVGFADTPTRNIWYKKIGNIVYVSFHISGTSNAINATFTLPYTNKNSANNRIETVIRIQDNSSDAVGLLILEPNSATVSVHASISAGDFTDSGNKIIQGQFFYEAE